MRARERIVGSSAPRRSVRSRKSVFLGGSSRFFRMALAALRFMSSAVSTITTRQPPSARRIAEERDDAPHSLHTQLR